MEAWRTDVFEEAIIVANSFHQHCRVAAFLGVNRGGLKASTKKLLLPPPNMLMDSIILN